MKTLLEELLRSDLSVVTKGRSISPSYLGEFLNHCELIKAGNVAKYFFEGTGQEEWNILEDFPNVAPVFENMFFEWEIPDRMLIGNQLIEKPEKTIEKVGIFIAANENPSGMDNIRWCLNCLIFLKPFNEGIRLAPAYFFIFVNKNGHPVDSPNQKKGITWMCEKYIPQDQQDKVYSGFRIHIDIALLTLSFMHCKNILITQYDPHNHPKGRTRHASHIKHYTLEIDPMRKILESKGGASHNGIKKALHICRGHFKTFSEEKPLLGKAAGTFWWADHMRGSIQNGLIDKDYEVKNGGAKNARD